MNRGAPTRPMPADFAERAAAMSDKALRGLYATGSEMVRRWRQQSGIAGPTPIDSTAIVPADFAAVAPGQSIKSLMTHYRRDSRTIKRWMDEAGIPRVVRQYGNKVLRPMPDDFLAVFTTLSIPQLKERYSAGGQSVRRWIAEAGQSRKPGARRTKTPVASKPVVIRAPAPVPRPSRPTVVSRKPGNPGIVNRIERDMTSVGQAADFLRKYSGVWRCTPTGSPDPKGTHWRRGSSILTDAEIIERAEGLGWDADAWRRVA